MKTLTNTLKVTFKTFCAISLIASMVTSYADDTEVFYSKNTAKPNLLFVLDNSGSMTWDMAGNRATSAAFSGTSRVSVLNTAVQSVLASAPDNVNIGVMRFGPVFANSSTGRAEYFTANESNRTHGVSGISFPITDINAKARTVVTAAGEVYNLPYFPAVDETVREYITEIVNDWSGQNLASVSMGTPLVDALYEAALYFRGEQMRYGFDAPNGATGVAAHPSSYSGSVITSDFTQTPRNYANAPNYISPISSSCSSNYIVLMSDGEPFYAHWGAANVQGLGWGKTRGAFADSLQGSAGSSQLAANISSCVNAPSGFTQGKCGPEITAYIAGNDNIADPSDSNLNGLEGDQLIKTFSIGFGGNLSLAGQNYLRSLETIDDDPETPIVEDGFFLATDPASLADAFRRILTAVAEPRGTLASPGYSVNVKNGLEHENDIYVPVFDRKNASRWSGNLKKFKLIDVDGKRHIRGKNGLDATNELGGFSGDAIDYWSDASDSNPDGINVQRGGLANKLDNPEDRKVYSNLTSNANLWHPSNHVKTSNMSNLTNSVLGLSSTSTLAYRQRIIRFMRGRENGDSNGAPRFHMGDMLHSEPLVVTYNKGDAAGNGKVQYIFAGTNEGYLHAFNTADYTSDSSSEAGKEMFAFIPKELLGTISESQYLNAGTQVNHKYGVDGALTVWFNDVNKNGVVDDGSDQVILYFGLRRGGTSYYALDVTNINRPKLLWVKSVYDYASMGQSWSIPYLAKVGVGADKTPTEVMIISGGYDEDEDRDLSDGTGDVDNAQSPVTANVGNDILILDAKNGNLLWSLSSAQRGQIRSSIPGGVRILDTNYNGLVDRIYFADTGGNVWRLDLTEKIGDTSAPASDLTKLAELGGSGINARKFFNEPDVAKMKLRGKTVFAVSIGSGFRAHPMDKTIDDKFFVLVDESPYRYLLKTGPEDKRFSTITAADLANITISSSGISHAGSIKDTDKRGWQVNFGDSGEKVLGGAIAIDGNILFTSLVPKVLQATDSNGIDECAAPITQSRFYAINILTGGAGMDLDRSGTVTDDVIDTYTTVSTEILGKPQVVYNPFKVSPDVDGDGNPTGTRGCTHPVDIRTGKKLTQASGYDACRLESVYWSDPVSEQ